MTVVAVVVGVVAVSVRVLVVVVADVAVAAVVVFETPTAQPPMTCSVACSVAAPMLRRPSSASPPG